MNYNPEIERTPVNYFLLGLKWVNPHLVSNFEVGRHNSDPNLEAEKQHKFDPDLEAGRCRLLIWILSQNDL